MVNSSENELFTVFFCVFMGQAYELYLQNYPYLPYSIQVRACTL